MKLSKRRLILGVTVVRLVLSPLLAEEPESARETGIIGPVSEGKVAAPLPSPELWVHEPSVLGAYARSEFVEF